MKLTKFLLIALFCISLQPGIALGKAATAHQKLVLFLDWYANANHAPIFIAKEAGFFKKHGLEVEIITPADPSDPPKWIALNRGDLALDYQPHVALAIAKGLPVKQVGTLIKGSLNALVVLQKENVKEIQDLKGRSIAYSTPEIDLPILAAMLKKANLSLQDVVPINVHYGLTQALLSRKVAGAIGMMRNIEVVELQSLNQPVRIFLPQDYRVPVYNELVFIANQRRVLDDRYQAFFAALNEAVKFLQKNPQQSWQIFSAHHQEINNALNKKMWFASLTIFADNFSSHDDNMQPVTQFFLKLNPQSKNTRN